MASAVLRSPGIWSYSAAAGVNNVPRTQLFSPKRKRLAALSARAAASGTVFVAGATGKTGKLVVSKLLAKGFYVRAGVRDVQKAKNILPSDDKIEFVMADVTQEPEALASRISGVDAVICATGFTYSWDVLAPWKVDYRGTVNLVEACRKCGVNRFLLVSSILVNGAAWGQALNPAYLVLNAFGLTLVAKLQAEKHIRQSGINYTIVRPGGLSNERPSGGIVMAPEDTLSAGSISRESVAQVLVEALDCEDASYKVVEIVAEAGRLSKSVAELFPSVPASKTG